MSTTELLREKHQELAELYKTNIASARSLQDILEMDILPGLVDELGLDGEGEQRAKLWLNDTQSVFRLLRRQKFTVPFALENARDVLLWRLAVIPDVIPRPIDSFLQCLPLTARDPFNRPLVVIRLSRLFEASADVRPTLIAYLELLRLNLENINEDDGSDGPVLQYIALMDIGGISVQNVQNVDIISWFIYELVPRFPGMLAAVFILNYSWAHSGVWNIVKRALPKSALSRVFFPSQDELLEYLPPSAIPRDYGGGLPLLSELGDPLEKYTTDSPETASPTTSPAISPGGSTGDLSPPSARLSPTSRPIPRVPSISPTSHLNPYFGYPVSGRGAPTPRLRHGRQRKRDLLRTLAALWWCKWKHRVLFVLCVLIAIISYRLRRNPRMIRWRQGMRGLFLPPARAKS